MRADNVTHTQHAITLHLVPLEEPLSVDGSVATSRRILTCQRCASVALSNQLPRQLLQFATLLVCCAVITTIPLSRLSAGQLREFV